MGVSVCWGMFILKMVLVKHYRDNRMPFLKIATALKTVM